MQHIGDCRKKFSIFTQTISGADYLNKHSNKIGAVDSPICNQCNEEGTEEDLIHAMVGTVTNVFTKIPVVEPMCHPVLEIVRFLSESDIDFLPTVQDIN